MNRKYLIRTLISLVFIMLFSILFLMKDINGELLEHSLVYVSVHVENGDSLWSMSEKYNDTDFYTHNEYIAMLSEINNIDLDDIKAGTNLIVPIIIFLLIH